MSTDRLAAQISKATLSRAAVAVHRLRRTRVGAHLPPSGALPMDVLSANTDASVDGRGCDLEFTSELEPTSRR